MTEASVADFPDSELSADNIIQSNEIAVTKPIRIARQVIVIRNDAVRKESIVDVNRKVYLKCFAKPKRCKRTI